AELAPTLLIGGHWVGDVLGEVDEGRAWRCGLHPFGGVAGARQQHGQPAGVLLVALPGPADAARVVEVVELLAPAAGVPRFEEAVDEPAVTGQDDVVLLAVVALAVVLGAVIVADEDERVTAAA